MTVPAACGSRRTGMGGADDEVTLWHRLTDPDDATVTVSDVVTEFNRRHPGLTVSALQRSEEDAAYLDALRSSVKDGRGPDIAQVPSSHVSSLAVDGLLADVTAEAEQYRDSFPVGSMARAVYDGRTRGLPVDSSPLLLCWEPQSWTQAEVQPPTAWDQVPTIAGRLHERGLAMCTVPTGDPAWFKTICDLAGCPWFLVDEHGHWTVRIDSPEVRALLRTWQGLVRDGTLPISDGLASPSTYQGLAAGRIVGHVGAFSQLSDLARAMRSTGRQWKVGSLPHGDDGQAAYGGSTWAVMKGCQHVTEALAVVDQMSENPALLIERDLMPAATSPKLTVPKTLRDLAGSDDVVGEVRSMGGEIDTVHLIPPVWPVVEKWWAGFSAAWRDGRSIADQLPELQSRVVAAMRAARIHVNS